MTYLAFLGLKAATGFNPHNSKGQGPLTRFALMTPTLYSQSHLEHRFACSACFLARASEPAACLPRLHALAPAMQKTPTSGTRMVTGHSLKKHAAAPSILPVSFALAGPILPVFFAPAPSCFRAILLRPLFPNSLLQPIEERLAGTQHQEAVSL